MIVIALYFAAGGVQAQNETDYDAVKSDFAIGAVLKIATGDGVGLIYRQAFASRLSLRVRFDALLAPSHVSGEYNYVEVRPGVMYDVPIRKVLLYFGADTFYGYFQDAIAKTLTHHEIGFCGVAGVRSYPVFHNISIGLETGPKFGYRVKTSIENMPAWNNNSLNDLFIYLIFQF